MEAQFLQHPYPGNTEQGVDMAEKQPNSSPCFQVNKTRTQGCCLPDTGNLVQGMHTQTCFLLQWSMC